MMWELKDDHRVKILPMRCIIKREVRRTVRINSGVSFDQRKAGGRPPSYIYLFY